MKRNLVFISYGERDKGWLEKLQDMLKPTLRGEKILVWDNTQIPPGSLRDDEINNALATAKVAVLMVSANFLASDSIAEYELPSLLAAAAQKHLRLIWIYLSACEVPKEIKAYEAAHDTSKPLNRLEPAEQDQVLLSICKKIKKAAIAPIYSTSSRQYQEVINKSEPLNKQSNPKVSRQQLRPTSSQRPIQTPAINTQKTIARPPITRLSISTVDNAVAVGKKIWFILLPLVIIWFFVGAINQSFISNINSTQVLIVLIISGSLGGFFSGLAAWIAWWRIVVARRSVQWEQALLCSIIGLIGGAIGWAIIGNTLNNQGGNLREYGHVFGLFFGLIVVVAILGWLSLRPPRT
ncbi:toll/interleukin-1 receptor domain-containing protein [Dendronalium sp. ChiSLP03b]|uniref:toll/interleukin-1 receptor domain-containing protein n=1 Tax=Dendronalium sp. ChiSLP03b TaxID=3075381 RepID=UPI002AD4F122|nr:toll/interleukin-1 receptor domain-containing protein [Dendronalium sp. ChiSLP03b]MDZ8205683.1 toll/interleukin-1 receptor domain-containing protein [Dendronalium sp. ChiSLP03b]